MLKYLFGAVSGFAVFVVCSWILILPTTKIENALGIIMLSAVIGTIAGAMLAFFHNKLRRGRKKIIFQ